MAATLQILDTGSDKLASDGRAREGGQVAAAPDSAGVPARVGMPAAKKLADLLTASDLEGAVKVWRSGLKARRMVWNNKKGKFVPCGPDWQIRRDMSEFIAAYMEGKPMERQMQISGTFEELGDLLRTLQTSGEAARLLPFVNSLPSAPDR